SNVVETSIPWPDAFTKLGQLHKALNLVYTFCCTRKHLATTLDTIKSAVEANIKRKLDIEDVAKVKRLVPQAINFQYVDEELLQVALMGEEDLRQGKKRVDDMFPANPMEDRNTRQAQGKGEHNEVLLFEFIDGDLKRQVQHPKTGEPMKAFRKLREEELKMPVYSQKQMMKLIEKRNTKFTSAVNAWLNECAEQNCDP
ncbi:P-loop containing nucleoside triphosphate hydrolase protein, partial [Hortaea werneckii]